MTLLSNALITNAFQVSAWSYRIEDCTFHGISLTNEQAAPVYLKGIFHFKDGEILPSCTCSMKDSVISQCMCVAIPNINTAGAIYLFLLNFSMNRCLLYHCLGYYASINMNGCAEFKINNSLTKECIGTQISHYEFMKSEINYHNISDVQVDYLNFFAPEENKMNYCAFYNIQNCKEAFVVRVYSADSVSIGHSNFVSCNFQLMKGNFSSCYFEACTVDNNRAIFVDCFIDDKSKFNPDVTSKLNSSSMMDLPIKKINEYVIAQKDLIKENYEGNQIVNVSLINDNITIKKCVFIDILRTVSIDTVVLIQNALIRHILIERSYFQNITTSSNAGILYLSNTKANATFDINRNFVHNCFNTMSSFLCIGEMRDIDARNHMPLAINSTVITFDNKEQYNSESVMRCFGTQLLFSYSNITTSHNLFSNQFMIFTDRTANNSFTYSNFYDSSNILCLYTGNPYSTIENCNFVNIHSTESKFNAISGETDLIPFKKCAFINCTFNNLSIPMDCNLIEGSSEFIKIDNVHYNWATPKIPPQEKDSNRKFIIILISCLAGCVVIIVTILTTCLIQKKHFDFLKERKQLESTIIDDFG